jgi:hypothetical protein
MKKTKKAKGKKLGMRDLAPKPRGGELVKGGARPKK